MRFACFVIAWMIGGALFFFTLGFTDYDGFNTFVTGIIGGAIYSTISVAACALAGLLLLMPRLARFWRASYVPVCLVALLGVVLFAFAFVPGQLKVLGADEDGRSIKELGTTWLPGYLLMLFALTNFPVVPKIAPLDLLR